MGLGVGAEAKKGAGAFLSVSICILYFNRRLILVDRGSDSFGFGANPLETLFFDVVL